MLSLRNVSAQQAQHYYKREDRTSPNRSLAKSETSSLDTTWFGTGADRLSLNWEIEPADFQKILEGTSPSGESLSARKIDLETRRAATDFTFSAPKSVSIAALVQGDRRVVEAHDQAVRSVLTVMEAQYSQTRVRTDQGQVKVSTNNLLVGIFRHETSREQDPQLHSHALVMNCTQLNNGQWRSLSNELIVHHSKFLGQIYQNELAHQMSECGYEVEQRDNGQFELKGYAELLETFSTRRQQIEEHLAPIEAPTLKQREHAALTTRQAKVQIDAEVLNQRWEEKLVSLDASVPEIPEPADRPDLTKVVSQWAIAHCDERGNVFRRGAAEQYVVENFTGQVSLANFRNALREEAVVLDELTGLMMSERSLRQELDSIQVMEAGKRPPLDDLSDMTEGQTAAEQASLTQLNDAIALNFAMHDQLMSWQRSGKGEDADRLKRYKELAEQAGYSVKGYAPSLETAQWLAEDVGMETEPIATLFNLSPEPQSEELDEEPELEIWVVDQAIGMSPEAMSILLDQAQEHQVRLILIEDCPQSGVKIPGNPFQALQQAGMQTVEIFGASLETLHAFSLMSKDAFKNDNNTKLKVEIEPTANEKIRAVDVAFSLEILDASSSEQEETFESIREMQVMTEHDRSTSTQVNYLAPALLEQLEVEADLANSPEPELEESLEIERAHPQLSEVPEAAVEVERINSPEPEEWVEVEPMNRPEPEETAPKIDPCPLPLEPVTELWDGESNALREFHPEAWVEVESQSSSEVESIVPDEAEVEVSQSERQPNEDSDRTEFIAQLTQTTVQYFKTQLKRGEASAVDGNLARVESPDYWVRYYHNEENGQPPLLQVQDKASNSTVFEILRQGDQWEAEVVAPGSEAWLEQATQELLAAGQGDRAEFSAQLTRITVQYFNTQLRQGEVTAVDSNLAVVESADYWVAYYHNQENGETPMFRVQDKATNSAVLEIQRQDEQWDAELVKPDAGAWLEQASRELAAQQERAQQTQKPQMEL
jgi:conjugative relaxase-like TrwC/TraI family protein